MSSYYKRVLKRAQAEWPAGYLDISLVDWDAVVYGIIADTTAATPAEAIQRQARRQTLLAPPTGSLGPVYLWRNFATIGQRANEHEIYIPFAAGRYAVCSFRDYIATSGGALYWGRFKEGVPVVNLASNNVAVTKVGTWALSSTADMYNGTSQQSSTAADTMTATVTGHTLILRVNITSNGGFALVSIDGSFTAATALPAVVQADVDAGYFVSGDIGKRYIEFYSTVAFSDEHILLAEGLTDGAHTVQVLVQGTKRAASAGTRVYVSAFAAATAGTLVTDANASMGYVRDISNLRAATAYSKMTIAPEYTPTGFVNFQFLGGNHGNETLVSQQFLVDGVVSAPTAGQYVSGATVRSELVTNLIHPSTGATVMAVKTGAYTATANGRLTYTYNLAWAFVGTSRNSYYGMMHVGTRQYPVAVLENTVFNRFLVGNNHLTSFALNNESAAGLSASDLSAGFSTLHDTVASLYLPNLAANVDNYSRTGTGMFLQDRTDLTEKLYASRSSTAGPEAITASTVHTGEIQWRMKRITNAATVLGF